MNALTGRLVRYGKICLLASLLTLSPAQAAKPVYYDGSSNAFYDMFMAMMDMFGMVDVIDRYDRNPRNPYSSFASPFSLGGMGPMGASPFGMSPWNSMYGMNQWDANKWLNSINNPAFNGATNAYQSPLEGVWLSTAGDVLVFLGSRFFYRANGRHLVGNAQIDTNRIIADIDDSEEVVKFQYETKGQYLAVKVSDNQVIYFQKQI